MTARISIHHEADDQIKGLFDGTRSPRAVIEVEYDLGDHAQAKQLLDMAYSAALRDIAKSAPNAG